MARRVRRILKKVLSEPDQFQVVTKRGEIGRAIHTNVIKFDPLEKSGFCGTCHDVNLLNGFRLEEAFSQFKNSPANKRGETCQDCHMGKIPGVKSGYAFGPAAMVGDKPTPPRKLTDHRFAGPDYSVIHPGLFPFNVKAQELATMREWLQFDYRAGWGTDAFEKSAGRVKITRHAGNRSTIATMRAPFSTISSRNWKTRICSATRFSAAASNCTISCSNKTTPAASSSRSRSPTAPMATARRLASTQSGPISSRSG